MLGFKENIFCALWLICQNNCSVVIGALFVAWLVHKFHLVYPFFQKVDKESHSHGGELVADTLKAHGVEYIFTLVGGHISPILVACEKIGIRVIDTRHEATAVFAADALARLSGKISVAVVTAGPGVTNTVTAIKNAQMDEAPVLLIGGASASILQGRGALQDMDSISLFKQFCKFTANVTRIRDIVPVLKQAIMQAQSGTPGPVFVGLSIDVLFSYGIVNKEILTTAGKAALVRHRLMRWYFDNCIHDVFAGAFLPRDTSPLHISIPTATMRQVNCTAEMLTRAKRPILVLGSQAIQPPVTAAVLRTCVEKIGIPCYLVGISRGLLGKVSPIHVRYNHGSALQEADLVILAGQACDYSLGYGKKLPSGAKIIAVNRNKEKLYMNSDVYWYPTMAIQGDVASFIVELANKLGDGYTCSTDWLDQLKQGDIEKEQQIAKIAQEKTSNHLNPLKVLQILKECLSENSVVIADGGDFSGTAKDIIQPSKPLRWLDIGAFGTLGVGGGFALAAKLLYPESDVWIIYGDGSLGYSVAEFDTFIRHKVPVIAVVGNDASWTQTERKQVVALGSNVACALRFTDYHVIANGYGGEGVLLEKSSNIKDVLENARKLYSENQAPVLVNTLIGKTSYRDGFKDV